MLPRREAPIVGFANPVRIIHQSLQAMRPPRRITVSDAAERHRRLNNPGSYVGPWRNDMAPYLVEPMNAALLRSVSVLAIAGPSQFGKTEIPLNIIGHAIKYRPADMLLFEPTKYLALDFAKRRVNKSLLDASKDLQDELGDDRGDDNVLEKTFRRGMMLTIAWPTTSQLSSRPVPIVIFDERDSMPDSIAEEGDPVELGKARTTTFGANGIVIVLSTFKRTDGTGMIVIVKQGDCRLWHWKCPECEESFAPGFDAAREPTTAHLVTPLGLDGAPDYARAHVVCPHCGHVIEENQKAKLNLGGVWVARGQSVLRDGTIVGTPPATDTRSYWFCGLASNFKRWSELARDLHRAEQHFARTQDEEPLKAVHNTGFGFPYKLKADAEARRDAGDLRARAQMSTYLLGNVPDGVRFIAAAVDVHGDRFEVTVQGFGADGESWLIDRFSLKEASDGSQINPSDAAAHWDVLLDGVIKKTYPLVSDPNKRLMVATTSIDTGGEAGVSVLSESFARRAFLGLDLNGRQTRPRLDEWRITLIKGAAQPNAPLVSSPKFRVDDRGHRLPDAVAVFHLGVHSLKNIIDVRLRKKKPGPGFQHFAKDTPDYAFDELVAEHKAEGKWEREGANETWDGFVYCLAGALRLRPDRVNWQSPPSWAAPVTIAPPAEPARVIDGAPAAPIAAAVLAEHRPRGLRGFGRGLRS